MPPRRLLAVAAAVFMAGAYGDPASAASQDAAAGTVAATAESSCKLGSFKCAPRPVSYALCRPNAMLEFYDPALTKDATLRETALTKTNATSVDSSETSVYHFQGDVRIERADQLLQADDVHYNQDSTHYDAQGNVRYQEAGSLMSADHMVGTTDPQMGDADNVRYQMLSGRGNGIASHAKLIDAQRSHYTQATYSTCDVGHHLWEFRAKRIDMDKEKGVGVAHSATMRYKNVPFLYVPYMSFPLDDRRKSGFLYPGFGHSSQSGLYLALPYYLNLAPNYDATVEPRYYSERGFMLAGEFRYLFAKSAGTLNVEFMPNDKGGEEDLSHTSDRDGNKQRYLVKFADNTNIAPGWSFGTAINRASDNQYFRDFSNDLYGASTGLLASNAYVYGNGNWWHTSIGADIYQNVDAGLPNRVAPYKRWPRATFNMDVPLARWLDFGMDTEAVAFRKSYAGNDQVEGNRLDLQPYLAADFQGASWFVRPKLAYRYTAYDLLDGYERFNNGNSTGLTDKTPSRALPIASVDAGLIFDRTTNLFGTSYTQTLEPRVYYLYVPYRNQSNQPLFDSSLMSFDFWQLFSPNQFSGADRQMNANNITTALTTRLLDDNGVERVSASIGQIHYLNGQRVTQTVGLTAAPPPTFSRSDYVAQFAVQLNDQWRMNSSYQWNPNRTATARDANGTPILHTGRDTDLATVTMQRRLGVDGILNFSYRYRRNVMEQFDTSAVYPISDRWRVLGRWTLARKDIIKGTFQPSNRTLEADAGIEYENCCVALRLIGRHYVHDYTRETANAIMFDVEFKGLGSFSPQTGDYLRRAILGYQ
jgi:LPS-assembly protein